MTIDSALAIRLAQASSMATTGGPFLRSASLPSGHEAATKGLFVTGQYAARSAAYHPRVMLRGPQPNAQFGAEPRRHNARLPNLLEGCSTKMRRLLRCAAEC